MNNVTTTTAIHVLLCGSRGHDQEMKGGSTWMPPNGADTVLPRMVRPCVKSASRERVRLRGDLQCHGNILQLN